MVKVSFDVDGTLIHQVGAGQDVPRYDVIQLFKLYESFGCEMYIWSGSGVEWARTWRDKLNLTSARVVGKGSFVPDIAIDDIPETRLGRVDICVGPSSLAPKA